MRLSLPDHTKGRVLLLAALLLIILLTLGLQLRYTPWFTRVGVDSGVFAYIGQQILEGKLPYRDIWDHKPPAVFYLNALAILLVGQTPWAIWWLAVVWILSTTILLYLILRKLTASGPALLATILFLVTLHHPEYYQRGNFPEVYSLLPQVLTIGVLMRFVSSRRDRWVVAIGLLTALALLLKHTCIAMGLASLGGVLLIDIRQRTGRKALWHLFTFAIGISVPFLVVILYWGIQGALTDLWQSVVTYNLLYSQMDLFIKSLYFTIRELTLPQPLSTVITISLASLAVFLVKNWRSLVRRTSHETPMMEVVSTEMAEEVLPDRIVVFTSIFAAIPLEIVFLSIVSRQWGHYFLTPLPVLAASSAYLFFEIYQSRHQWKLNDFRFVLSLSLVTILILSWFLETFPNVRPKDRHITTLQERPSLETYLVTDQVEFIWKNTETTDSVLMWGLHANINFLSGRRSPSKYIYALPLIMAGYDNQHRFEEFMQDLEDDPPLLIMAQPDSSYAVPYFDVEEDALCPDCDPGIREGLLMFKQYVEDRYTRLEGIGSWQIYQRVD